MKTDRRLSERDVLRALETATLGGPRVVTEACVRAVSALPSLESPDVMKAVTHLMGHQRPLDEDGTQVAVSREALELVIEAYVALASEPIGLIDPIETIELVDAPISRAELIDALGYFWNAAMSRVIEGQDFTSLNTISAITLGVQAVADRLREQEKQNAQG